MFVSSTKLMSSMYRPNVRIALEREFATQMASYSVNFTRNRKSWLVGCTRTLASSERAR